jgi:hypothetical protein
MPDAMTVRWKSLAGVGLILVLIYGLINFAAAIGVPTMLEKGGAAGGGNGGVMIGRAPEEFMLGTTYDKLATQNPKLDKLLVDSMVGMCSQMMVFAIAYLAIAWFAARRGQRWAVWTLLVSGVAYIPYYFIIASDMAAFGAPDVMKAAWMVAAFAIPAVLGSILLFLGLRRSG